MPIEVSSIYCYPIKSLGGMQVDSAEIGPRGVRHDRRWMIVDDQGEFLSQRSRPELCYLSASVTEGELRIQDRSGELVSVDREPSGERMNVCVWDDSVEALRSPGADAWLSERLGQDVRLVYMPDDARRFAPKGVRDPISFADAYPALVVSEQSLEELNHRLEASVGVNRFRPNIVLRGSGAFAEDEWRHITIGEAPFHFCRLCARCNLTTIDPQTALFGVEPLRTLAQFRLIDQKACFGAYFGPDGAGRIEVGAPVEIG